jgi:hypothetical protein
METDVCKQLLDLLSLEQVRRSYSGLANGDFRVSLKGSNTSYTLSKKGSGRFELTPAQLRPELEIQLSLENQGRIQDLYLKKCRFMGTCRGEGLYHELLESIREIGDRDSQVALNK